MNDILTSEDFTRIGHTGGLHGFEGGVRLGLKPGFEDFLRMESAFIYFIQNGMFVPYFIRSWNEEQGVVTFERISQREDGILLTDQDVYLRNNILADSKHHKLANNPEFSLLESYSIWNVDKNHFTGSISAVHEFPGGWMAEVSHPSKPETFLIPLAEPLIDRIDEERSMLYMHLPEGLEEL